MKSFWMGLAALLLVVSPLRADDAAKIRARTSERRPVIVALVKSGAVEEADSGFLKIKDAAAVGDKAPVVEAENRDRKAAYAAIARDTGVDAAEVARRQAQRWKARAKK